MFVFRHLVSLLVALFFAVVAQDVALSQVRPAELPREAPAARPNPVKERATIEVEEAGTPNGFYDLRNPDYKTLQKADEARAGLPLDKRGKIDWMTALRNGAIKPRSDLTGSKPNEVLNLDIILKNTKEMPWVKFPHNSHTEWLACSNCHDKIFVPKAGGNAISMEKIFRGEFCGACHDRVAFVTHYSCERCHSVPHGDTKAWW